MRKKKSSQSSLADIARAAGVSKSAVCFALQNRPKVSLATRRKVLQIAKQLGYVPDARLTAVMARVRDAGAKSLLPIAWLNTSRGENDWTEFKFLSPYLEGAQARCLELGYRLEEIWTRQPGMTNRRLSQILYQRGIEGVIVTYPAWRVQLNWGHLAGISLGGGLLAPGLNNVNTDAHFNLTLAVKTLKRLGYRRIGVCIPDQVDRFSHHVLRSSAHYLHLTTAKANQVPPLFYPGEAGKGGSLSKRMVAGWLQRHRPDVVVGASTLLGDWLKEMGLRIPEDIGLIHLSLDDDVLHWSGIHSNKREIGRTAASHVISMIQIRQFGIPSIVSETLVRGGWHSGATLLNPKPKALLSPE